MNDMWFAALAILLILTVTLGSALFANCLLLNEICAK
jgi:hypothetical protein